MKTISMQARKEDTWLVAIHISAGQGNVVMTNPRLCGKEGKQLRPVRLAKTRRT